MVPDYSLKILTGSNRRFMPWLRLEADNIYFTSNILNLCAKVAFVSPRMRTLFWIQREEKDIPEGNFLLSPYKIVTLYKKHKFVRVIIFCFL